ncbi:MAG: molybdopterin cofactor-binding domain-containing protein, partial [Mycobacteriaceae bacterium]
MTATLDDTATATPEIGKSRLRKEDARLITGRSRYTDNLVLPGMLHAAILRSPFAHATITSLDVAEARKRPGVIAVYTGKDFAEEQGSLPCAWAVTPEMKAPAHPSIAVDTVHFTGEAVAVVIARTAYEAADALDGIEIDYDELPPVLDMEAALADGADLVHPDLGTNKCALWVFDSAEAGTGTSVEDAIASSEVVVTRRFRQQRLIPAFMEPRSVVCDPNGDQLTLWSATQVPHIVRTMMAMTLGLPEHK